MAKLSIIKRSILISSFVFLASALSGLSTSVSAQNNTVIDVGKMSQADFSNFAVDAVLAYGNLNMGKLTDGELNAIFNPGSRSKLNQFERQRYLSALEERKNARSRFFDRDSYPLLTFNVRGELVDYDFKTGHYAICYQSKIGVGDSIAISLTYPPQMIEPGRLLIGSCSSSQFNRLLVPMSPESAERLFNQTKEEAIQGSMRSTIRSFPLGVTCLLHESVGEGRDKNRSFPDCSVQDLDYQVQDAGLRQELRAPIIWGPHAPKVLGYAQTGVGIRWLSPQEQQEYLQRVAQDKVRREEAEKAAIRAQEEAEKNRIANLPGPEIVPCTNEGFTQNAFRHQHCEKFIFSHNEKSFVRTQKSNDMVCLNALANERDFDYAYEGNTVRITPKGNKFPKEAAAFEMLIGTSFNGSICGYRPIPDEKRRAYSLQDVHKALGNATWSGDMHGNRNRPFMMSVYVEGDKIVYELPASECRGYWISEEAFGTPGGFQTQMEKQSCPGGRDGDIRINIVNENLIQYEWWESRSKRPTIWGVLQPYEIYSKRQ